MDTAFSAWSHVIFADCPVQRYSMKTPVTESVQFLADAALQEDIDDGIQQIVQAIESNQQDNDLRSSRLRNVALDQCGHHIQSEEGCYHEDRNQVFLE